MYREWYTNGRYYQKYKEYISKYKAGLKIS